MSRISQLEAEFTDFTRLDSQLKVLEEKYHQLQVEKQQQ